MSDKTAASAAYCLPSLDEPCGACHRCTDPSAACLTCGHDSPHVQQYGDECFCGCVDYVTQKPDPSASEATS
jgi:hypothetical protein